jgi:hypothetical protein
MLKYRYATHQHSNNIRKPTIEIELKGRSASNLLKIFQNIPERLTGAWV